MQRKKSASKKAHGEPRSSQNESLCTKDDCTRASRSFSAAKKETSRGLRVCFDARDVSNESAQKSASKRLHITCGLLPECWDVSSEAAATSEAHLRKRHRKSEGAAEEAGAMQLRAAGLATRHGPASMCRCTGGGTRDNLVGAL